MLCPHCHQEHPLQVRVCPNTGMDIPDPFLSKEVVFCPYCSVLLRKGATYCTSCGKEIVSPREEETTMSMLLKKKVTLSPKLITFIAAGGVLLLVLILVLVFTANKKSAALPNWPATAENNSSETVEGNASGVSSIPLINLTPTQQSTPALNITETAISNLIVTSTPDSANHTFDIRSNDFDHAEMVYVPKGEFLMGSDPDSDPYFWGAEGPSHVVELDGFWIYRYEVTNGMYQACSAAGICPKPQLLNSRTRTSYYDNPDFVDFPVIYVTFTDATAYCRWVGGRLPTEAEWEKAARGSVDARLFPWSSSPADGTQANFCDRNCTEPGADTGKNDGYTDTSPVGNYPDGMSLYGLFDMAGNVWEWVADYFSTDYYGTVTGSNPTGPTSGTRFVIRGGGWNNNSENVRIVQRASVKPEVGLDTLGFRCVVDETE